MIGHDHIPILLCGVEACPTNSADKQSLQFTMNRVAYFLKFSVPWPKTLIWKLAVIWKDILKNSLLPFVKINFWKVQFVGQLFMLADSQTLIWVLVFFFFFFLFVVVVLYFLHILMLPLSWWNKPELSLCRVPFPRYYHLFMHCEHAVEQGRRRV